MGREAGSGDPEENFGDGRLKPLLRQSLSQDREVPPPKERDWIRVSSISGMCAREEVLAARTQTARHDKVNADLSLIFHHGHALHHQLQNAILPDAGVMRGKWRCSECGQVHGGAPQEGGPIAGYEEYQVPRPDECLNCEAEASAMLYVEQHMKNYEFRVMGHADGFLYVPDMPGMGVLEAKSISPKGAWEVRSCPKLDHVIQAQCYMWLTGLRWANILYWDKAGIGVGSLIEHVVEYDEGTVQQIQGMVTSLREAVSDEGVLLPDRVCANSTCPRARACSLSEVCFREPA